jgi:hypothetical protein
MCLIWFEVRKRMGSGMCAVEPVGVAKEEGEEKETEEIIKGRRLHNQLQLCRAATA